MLVPRTVTESEISQKVVTLSSNLHYSVRVRHLTKTAQIRCINLNINYTSSSSIGIETLVGYGLFTAERFLQSEVASGTSNPQPGGPMIRTFQLPPPGVPHV